MNNDDVITELNNLIETAKDGEYGFRSCAEQAQSSELKSLFLDRAAGCQEAATELQAQVAQLGGEPDTGGSASGAIHRGWVAVRGTLSGYDDAAVLSECERGEDVALKAYRDAMAKPLPASIASLVDRQYQGVKRNHDQIRSLRDQAKANS